MAPVQDVGLLTKIVAVLLGLLDCWKTTFGSGFVNEKLACHRGLEKYVGKTGTNPSTAHGRVRISLNNDVCRNRLVECCGAKWRHRHANQKL